MFPRSEVRLHEPKVTETGADPAEVERVIERWMNETGCQQVVINATGGRKTMYTGCLGMVGRSGVKVVYFDLGQWIEIRRRGTGFVSLPCDVGEGDLRARFRALGIAPLLQVQSGAERVEMDPPRPTDVLAVLDRVIEAAWDWRRSSFGDPGGTAFECWFANLLRELGVDDVRMNVKASNSNDGLVQHETDVWVLHDKRLFMFDLKLRSKATMETSLAEQMNNAVSQAQDLAGSMARTILVRPGYSIRGVGSSVGALARRLGCTVWYQEDMAQLPRQLTTLFGDGLDEALLAAVAGKLAKARHRHGIVFADPEIIETVLNRKDAAKGRIPLAGLLEYRQRLDKQQDVRTRWICVRAGNGTLMCRVCEDDRKHLHGWLARARAAGIEARRLARDECLLSSTTAEVLNAFVRRHMARSTDEPLFHFDSG